MLFRHFPPRVACALAGSVRCVGLVRSRKSQELKSFPHAAITFWWGALHRSVRFEGEVAMVSEEESDEYFSCRPTGSKVRHSSCEVSNFGPDGIISTAVVYTALCPNYIVSLYATVSCHWKPSRAYTDSRRPHHLKKEHPCSTSHVLLCMGRSAPGFRIRASRLHHGTR